jgi:predicted outer membrane repeat protein
VWFNSAAYGGGIAVLGHANDSASLSLFTANAAHPVSVFGNTASHTGGGVYLKGDTKVAGIGSTASMYARDFSFDQNIAANGAAIYGDTVSSNLFGDGDYHGVHVYLNGAFPATVLAPVACAAGQGCDDIAGNLVQDSNGKPTGGATVLLQSESELQANRFAARGNHGGSLFQFVDDSADYGPPPASTLRNCLLADNVESAPLILVTGNADGSRLTVDSCTITNNTVDTASVPAYTIDASVNYLQLTDSIIYDLGAQVVNFNHGRPAGDLTANYDLVNNSSTLPNGLGVLKGAPSFAQASQHDYHLLGTSLGVDYAPGESGSDLDGNPRTVDLPSASNVYGPMDLGAYEMPYRRIIGPIGPIGPVSQVKR